MLKFNYLTKTQSLLLHKLLAQTTLITIIVIIVIVKMMIMVMRLVMMMKVVVKLHEHMDHYTYTFYSIAYNNYALRKLRGCKVISANKILLHRKLTKTTELIYLVQLHFLNRKILKMCKDFSKHVLSFN